MSYLILSAFSNIVNADSQLEIGDYIQMGTYEGVPIMWRCVYDDEYDGKLMVSDKLLCIKSFDDINKSNLWYKSAIRKWLNSNEPVVIDLEIEATYTYYAYLSEEGFLSNFTRGEVSCLKPVDQLTFVTTMELSENTNDEIFYDPIKPDRKDKDSIMLGDLYSISKIPYVYYGAAMKTNDRVFLLDELQLYYMISNVGSLTTTLFNDDNSTSVFSLRNPVGKDVTGVFHNNLVLLSPSEKYGIRPAFYLNETAVLGMTGSGTAEDPYILVPDPDYVSVEVDGEGISYDVAPIVEDGRVLVPMRAIYEKMGATVEWEGETETVTATKDDTVITLQIDNNVMTKNGEEIILDVPARLVGDRTLVPIRAVAEGLDATVDWIDEENKVVITN